MIVSVDFVEVHFDGLIGSAGYPAALFYFFYVTTQLGITVSAIYGIQAL